MFRTARSVRITVDVCISGVSARLSSTVLTLECCVLDNLASITPSAFIHTQICSKLRQHHHLTLLGGIILVFLDCDYIAEFSLGVSMGISLGKTQRVVLFDY